MMGGDCSASWGLSAVGCHRSREGCRGLICWIHSHTRLPSETGSPSACRLKLRSHLMVVSVSGSTGGTRYRGHARGDLPTGR